MAKLIVKWRYIQSGTPKHCQRHIKYIATREGVEKCDNSWKYQRATREQQRLISDLLNDFPTSKQTHEYADYLDKENKYNASMFISKVIDENIDLIGKKENYVEYIAKRPRVEKQGSHGLFGQYNVPIDLNKVAKNVAEHKGVVWTTVLSLKREDAERLGYNSAYAWKKLLQSKTETLSKAMGIPTKAIRWYAAFHNEGNHPHVHIVSYSMGKQPFITEKGLEKMKSEFARAIFKQDLYQTYVAQTKVRDELRAEGKDKIKAIVANINRDGYTNERVERLIIKLKKQLKNYKGKKVYGYMPKSAKNIINGIVDEFAKDERIKELYDLWYEQKDEIVKIYQDTKIDRLPLSRNNEFKSIRNAVIKEVDNLTVDTDANDRKVIEKYNNKLMQKIQKEQEYRQQVVRNGAIRLFKYLCNILEENIDDDDKGNIGLIDRKEQKQINEKKQGLGLKY